MHKAIVIGAGPAGLMAAETLAAGGVNVDVYDAMPSVGRKFLMAGKGGMNITHSEPFGPFVSRYGSRRDWIEPLLRQFSPDDLRNWIHGLGIETFVGTSGRVFPKEMKAAPLLRAWLHRLRESGVRIHVRHRWLGWTADGGLRFSTPDGEQILHADATILALGGGSWARLGSDGAWVTLLQHQSVNIAPLRPANCGFDVGWSEHLRTRFAGQPIKPVSLTVVDDERQSSPRQGEFVLTETGVEGGLIYACSSRLRDMIERNGSALVHLDLLPGKNAAEVLAEVSRPRGSRSLSSHLQSRLGIKGAKAALLHELLPKDDIADPDKLAAAIKALPLRLLSARPLDEAISSAGGVPFEELDTRCMLHRMPGVFCAGEMLDWEAPTGGYLLTACFSSGRAAGLGVLDWFAHKMA